MEKQKAKNKTKQDEPSIQEEVIEDFNTYTHRANDLVFAQNCYLKHTIKLAQKTKRLNQLELSLSAIEARVRFEYLDGSAYDTDAKLAPYLKLLTAPPPCEVGVEYNDAYRKVLRNMPAELLTVLVTQSPAWQQTKIEMIEILYDISLLKGILDLLVRR